jgi:hypothetical protein
LKERPYVHKGIKTLRMEWDCEGHAKELDDRIMGFCEYLSKHLVFDELIFAFRNIIEIMQELVAGGESIVWVRAFKKINVRKLTAHLWISGEESDSDVDYDAVGDFSDSEDSGGDANEVDGHEQHDRDRRERLLEEWMARMEALLGLPV